MPVTVVPVFLVDPLTPLPVAPSASRSRARRTGGGCVRVEVAPPPSAVTSTRQALASAAGTPGAIEDPPATVSCCGLNSNSVPTGRSASSEDAVMVTK